MDLIPKILHLYWDKSPMSYLQALTVVSFRKYNPDWTINIYIPKQEYTGNAKYIPDYIGKDYFDIVRGVERVNIIEVDLTAYGIGLEHHNILRSDILRYYMLYEIGGVWSDFDVLWLQPISNFSNLHYYGETDVKDITAVVSFIQGTHGGHSIGILIHCKEDPYVASLIEATKEVRPPYSHEIFGGSMLNNKYPDLASLSGFKGLVGAKFKTYYPYNIHPPAPTISRLYEAIDLSYIDKEVLCLHWYNGHVLSKRYINGLGFKKSCSMTSIVVNEGYDINI